MQSLHFVHFLKLLNNSTFMFQVLWSLTKSYITFSLFFFPHKFISSWAVYHLVWNSLCIMQFANCIYPIKARELRPESRLVDTIHAFSRHHCRCHNVVQFDLAQIVLKFLPTNRTELLKQIITKDAIAPLWASNCKVSALFWVQLSRGGGCFWAFMSNTTPILVQLCKGMYVRGFPLGEPSPHV